MFTWAPFVWNVVDLLQLSSLVCLVVDLMFGYSDRCLESELS